MALPLILAVLCVVGTCAAQVYDAGYPPPPDRCARHSVTMVSCANVNSPDSLVPHPDDCNLFYYCVQPNLPPICRECPADLHFNPERHVCDWPYRAGCKICSWPSTTEYPTVSTTTYPTNSTGTDNPKNSTGTDNPKNSTGTDNPTNSTGTDNPTSSTASETPTDSTATAITADTTTSDYPTGPNETANTDDTQTTFSEDPTASDYSTYSYGTLV